VGSNREPIVEDLKNCISWSSVLSEQTTLATKRKSIPGPKEKQLPRLV